MNDEETEPEVPPGLSQLSAAQDALVEFLEIDPDLLAAAAAGSPAATTTSNDRDIDAWLTNLSPGETRVALKLLLQGQALQAERQIKPRFLAWQKENRQAAASPAPRRTVADLFSLAGTEEEHRHELEAEEQAREEAERRKQREAFLRSLAADFGSHWNAASTFAERGTASGYDEAQRMIANLAEACALVSSKDAFDRAMHRFMERHDKRPALVRRLVQAGLWKQ